MVIAMDFNGCLRSLVILRDLAKGMLAKGFEVHVISAVGRGDPHLVEYRQEIDGWNIPFTVVHFVEFDGTPTPDVAYRVGMQKVDVMRDIGASVLFDDNPHICRAVRDVGLLACQVA